MIKDAMEKNEKAAPNGADLEVLKKHFGMCFNSDGSLDLEKLKARLGDQVAISNEGYELKFLGKNYARLLTSLETETVVVPDEKHNAKPENAKSKNVYISGDNLDALKHLLKSKQGQVKCIYIDPPYNTGSDGFVYNDSFGFKVEELASKLSISEDEAQRILDFTKRGSASHSAWLMFMYPRLMLARELLAKDGVIFISIDDNEQANLKLMCDEIFGEENFVGNILWESTTQPDNIGSARFNFQKKAEYIAMYSRRRDQLGPFVLEEQKGEKKYPHQGKYGKCRFEIIERSFEGAYARPTMRFKILGQYPREGKQWQIGEELARDLEKQGKVEIVDGVVKRAVYPEDEVDEKCYKPFWSIFPAREAGTSMQGKDLLCEYLGHIGFDTVKPVQLLLKCFSYLPNTGLFVDFFSGSGTTAEAVMRSNLLDSGSRTFIAVQIAAECKDGSTAREAGYNTIDAIGLARVKKAAAKIAEENPLLAKTMDLGFKHYTLKEVEGKTLDKIEKFVPNDNALAATDDILKEFGVETVLATWLVHDGYGFSAEPKVVDLDGYKAYWMEKHIYLIEPGLSDKGISALFDKFETEGSFNPGNVVVFGYSFSWTQLEALKNNLLKIAANGTNKHVLLDKRY